MSTVRSPAADLILTNGRVFCGLHEGFSDAVAIAGERILAVGDAASVEVYRGPGTKTIDLAGRLAVPGLNEAHLHVVHVGLGMIEMNLRPERGIRSLDDIYREVAEAARRRVPGEWITGRGYDHNELVEGRHPSIEELDGLAPDNPVYIERTCGHLAVANSRALSEAGIVADTPDPEGGLIERVNGRLTGLLAERAMRLVVNVKPKPDVKRIVEAIERAGKYLLSQGFTSAMDAAVGFLAGMDELAAYDEAAATGRLPLRTWITIYGNPDEGIGDAAHAAGYRQGTERGRMRIGAMKIFADGSAGALTAAMSEPYLVGDPANRGILTYSQEVMHDYLARYHRQGYQLAIHAIGDVAIERVLSGIEAADTPDQPIIGRRHRIEHCGFLTDDQMARMVAAQVDPVPQPVFIYEFGDLYVANVGQERANRSYPLRKWIEAGLHPAASSDAPVCATDPFKNIYTMITRKTRRGTVIGADQVVTVAQALHAYTALGAYTQFAETEKGRIVPGLLADIAVFSRDIFAATPAEIETGTQCDLTILGGEVVFDRLA
jgi:predicted amidohydrolase YtcJ